MFFDSYYAKEILAGLVILVVLFGAGLTAIFALLMAGRAGRRALGWARRNAAGLARTVQEMLQPSANDSAAEVPSLQTDMVVAVVESVEPLAWLTAGRVFSRSRSN